MTDKVKIISEKLIRDFESKELHDYSLTEYKIKFKGVIGKVVLCSEITDKDSEGGLYYTDYVEFIDKNLKEDIDEIEQFLTN